jgi:hypothetical protein
MEYLPPNNMSMPSTLILNWSGRKSQWVCVQTFGAVLFGFGGLHFTENGIVQIQGILPKEWKSLTIKGVGTDRKTYTVR